MKSTANATEFNRLRAALLLRNMTLDDWASMEGYNRYTVRGVARRCLDREYRHVGMQTDEILNKMRTLIESVSDRADEAANGN